MTVGDVLRGWRPDPASLLVAAVLLVGYLRLAARTRPGGRTWPAGRTAAMVAGTVAILVATQSGIGRYDDRSFTVHMVQHLLLGMVAPFLIVCSAPVLLILQRGGPATRRGMRTVLASRPARVLTHPVVTWMLFGGGMLAIYLTGLLGLMARNDLVHLLVHFHLVAAGCLYLSGLVGLDPSPRPLAFPARLLSVLTAVPFHAILAMAILSSTSPLAPDAYPRLSDQRAGAGLMWGMGELFTLAVAAVVVRRWYVADQRTAARQDLLDDLRRAPA